MDRVIIAYGINDKYAKICRTSCYTLLKETKREVIIYIFTRDLSSENRRLFPRETRFIDISEYITQETFGAWYGSAVFRMKEASYYRLFVPFLLPDHKRVLYLDADTVIKGDIGELFDADLYGALVGGVTDMGILQMSYHSNYINAGVLLYNIPYILGAPGLLPKIKAQCKERYVHFDQDIINDVYRKDIRKLPYRYNVQPLIDAKKKIENYDEDNANPLVIHFLGLFPRIKNWKYGNGWKKEEDRKWYLEYYLEHEHEMEQAQVHE